MPGGDDVNNYLPLVYLYTDNRASIDGATRFQKLVFLGQQEGGLPDTYEFREDRFGPFSPDLRADLETLVAQDLIQRDIVTNRCGRPKIIYGLSNKGYRKARNLLNLEGNEQLFQRAQDIKRRFNDEPIQRLLQFVYNKYDSYVTATEIDLESLFDPDAQTEFSVAEPSAIDVETVGDELQPTPFTLWQMPKRETDAYFYYFTDESYSQSGSKYRVLDEELTLLGRNRQGLQVGIIDRDRIRDELWRAFIEGLDIDNYPTLIVADGPLGIQDVNLDADVFHPNDVNYATLESGLIQDNILQDGDKVKRLLNDLFDAAYNNELESKMRNEKIITLLTIGKDEVKDFITFSP